MSEIEKHDGQYFVVSEAIKVGDFPDSIPRDLLCGEFEIGDDCRTAMRSAFAGVEVAVGKYMEEAYLAGVLACLSEFEMVASQDGLYASVPSLNPMSEAIRIKDPKLIIYEDDLPSDAEVASAILTVTLADGSKAEFPVAVEVL